MRVVNWFLIAVVAAVLAIGMTACGEYEEPGVGDREGTENSMMERMEEQREGQSDGERGDGSGGY
jgi:uncharacterized lipoprotein YehR (DUF1307 family)